MINKDLYLETNVLTIFAGLLGDSLSCSIDDPYGVGRWRSEVDLKGSNNGITSPRASSATGNSAATSTANEENCRKISPPLAAVLASSRIRYCKNLGHIKTFF